jgi:hypothetical protein
MTVIRLRSCHLMAESSPAASRENRDGIVDIGSDESLRRHRAAEKLEDALRFYRAVYGSKPLTEVLKCRLDAEQRLVSRELGRVKP